LSLEGQGNFACDVKAKLGVELTARCNDIRTALGKFKHRVIAPTISYPRATTRDRLAFVKNTGNLNARYALEGFGDVGIG
jgi:hypothetical protein